MLNIDTLFFFLFVFCILIDLRVVLKYVGTLLQREPTQVVLSGRELIYFGLSISYLITYIKFS